MGSVGTCWRPRLVAVAAAVLVLPLLALMPARTALAGVYDTDGEVTYKEYWVPHSQFTGTCPEHSGYDADGGSWFLEPGPCVKTVLLTIPDDFSSALKAEIFVDYWRERTVPTGRYQVNDGPVRSSTVGADWSRTPLVAPIPLAELRQGTNELRFSTDPGWKRHHLHDVAIRIYHDATHPLRPGTGSDVTPPSGSLTSVAAGGVTFSPGAGGTLQVDNDQVTLAASASGAKFVEFHGYYEGYDEDNDGQTVDWHSFTRNNHHPGGTAPKPEGGTTGHLGTDTSSPYQVTWKLPWVPNQAGVRFKVRLVDAAGNVREAPGGVSAPFTLSRSFQVAAYRIPNFADAGIHQGGSAPDSVTRTIELPDLTGVTSAHMVAMYWQNPFVSFNGAPAFKAFTSTEDVWKLSVRTLDVSQLRQGANQITYSYNANQVAFGQHIEKPGPMVVLRGGTQQPTPPTVVTHPADQTVLEGSTATFSVVASGSSPLSYQWQRNGVNLAGATKASYATSTTAADNGATYRVVVTNPYGSITSNPATLTVTTGGSDGPWWDASRRFRVPVVVGAGGADRADKPVDAAVDFTSLFQAAGRPGSLDPDSIRVVEVDAAGTVVDDTVAFQFDPDATYDAAANASGEVVFVAEGTTAAGATRTFHVYFDTTGLGFDPPAVADQVVFTDGVIDEGHPSYRLATPAATWYYHKQGGGFSSIVDPAGNDWVGWNATTGSGGTYRGLPNAVNPEGYFHPGSTASTSSIVHRGPVKVTIRTVTNDGAWEALWEVYPRYATMTMVRTAHDWWFLYEGTPGGSASSTADVVVRSDGTQTTLGTAWSGDLGPEEWVYFGDPNVGRSLFAAHHENDTAVDSHRLMDGRMTVFGFGRASCCTTSYLASVPQHFTVGLMDTTAFSTGAPVVRAAYTPLSVTLGRVGSTLPPEVVSPTSDDFSPAPLDASLWTFQSPVGDGSVTSNGTQAVIDVPGGAAHDLWTSGNNAVRITQPAPDRDFELEVKFESLPTVAYQMQGILVEATPTRWLRFEFLRDAYGVKLFVASINGATATTHRRTALSVSSQPVWLRVKRTGSTWTSSWSTDGTTFTGAHSFTSALAVAQVGTYAGNAVPSGGTSSPKFTARVDYFFNTASRIAPEDG